jgi:hypothetical protein
VCADSSPRDVQDVHKKGFKKLGYFSFLYAMSPVRLASIRGKWIKTTLGRSMPTRLKGYIRGVNHA